MADVDYTLRRQVDQLQGLVLAVDQTLSVVGGQVATIGQEQRQTQGQVQELRRELEAFVRKAELTANIQRAETKIGTLQDELEHTFGHHKVVRKSAVGMLHAFDVGLVSEETVRSVGEHLMVQTPRYWLAPVLVALAAWAADDPELCDQAVTEAFRRAPDRTSLFLALLLRRQRRQESAVRWLRHYLTTQDPRALSRDFAVILESISQGAFGPAARELVHDHLRQWREQLVADEAAAQAQVDRWRAEVAAHVGGSAAERFPWLAATCPQWRTLDQVLAAAGVHQSLRTQYGALAAEQPEPTDRLEDAVDDILDRLVQEYDPEELPLRREVAFQQAVIAHDGELAAARAQVERDSPALDDTQNFLTIQTMSALDPDGIGVSRATQRLAVAACHDWLLRAHAAFTADYRQACPEDVTITLGSHHNEAAGTLKLPAWKGSTRRPLPQLEQSLDQHWDAYGEKYVEGFAFDRKHTAILVIILGIPFLVIASLCTNLGIGILLTILGGGIAAAVIASKARAAEQRQHQARDLVQRGKHESRNQLRSVAAELTDWQTAYQEADGQEGAARDAIAELATLGRDSSAFERRTVRPHSTVGTEIGGQSGGQWQQQ